MTDLDLTPPDDPAETTARLITAAGHADCVRIAHLAWARTVADTPFTRDDILADWLEAWPHHQYPPFRRRPLQRLNIAWPILYATGLLEPVDDDPDLRKVRWPAIAYFLSERIGYSIQQESISVVDMTIPVDETAVATIGILVAELSNMQAAGVATLTVEADVIKGGT